MAMNKWKSLDPMELVKLQKLRRQMIAAAPATPLPKTYAVNELAKAMHPHRQYMTVTAIREWDKNCKTFELRPNPAKGTEKCAIFNAGQHVSVYLDIDGIKLTRAYSLCSSPKQSLEGKYQITVKYVQDGLVSRYILDNWRVGTEVELSGPDGQFDYQPLRDAPTVVGIAGGSGITPFMSLAAAIAEGTEDFDLTILYGSRTAEGIIFKDELDALAAKCAKLKVVNVLSDEEKEGYEHGFVTAELIKKYAPESAYSVFLCGPNQMYDFVDQELKKLALERKYIRHDLKGEVYNPSRRPDYPKDAPDAVSITVSISGETTTFTGSANDSLLQSLERHGIAAPSHCRSGECGWCRSYLKSGKVYIPPEKDGRRMADSKYGFIHPCCTFPLSDIELEVPPAK